MKPFIYSIITLVSTLALLFIISMALDMQFIQAYFVRQCIVYFCMALVLYLGLRIVYLINKNYESN